MLEKDFATKKLRAVSDKTIVSPIIIERLTELRYDKVFDGEFYATLHEETY